MSSCSPTASRAKGVAARKALEPVSERSARAKSAARSPASSRCRTQPKNANPRTPAQERQPKDANPRTPTQGRQSKDANPRTPTQGRQSKDANPRTPAQGRQSKDASPRPPIQGRQPKAASQRTPAQGRRIKSAKPRTPRITRLFAFLKRRAHGRILRNPSWTASEGRRCRRVRPRDFLEALGAGRNDKQTLPGSMACACQLPSPGRVWFGLSLLRRLEHLWRQSLCPAGAGPRHLPRQGQFLAVLVPTPLFFLAQSSP